MKFHFIKEVLPYELVTMCGRFLPLSAQGYMVTDWYKVSCRRCLWKYEAKHGLLVRKTRDEK